MVRKNNVIIILFSLPRFMFKNVFESERRKMVERMREKKGRKGRRRRFEKMRCNGGE